MIIFSFKTKTLAYLILTVFPFFLTPLKMEAFAQPFLDEGELEDIFDDEDLVTIATGVEQYIGKAPAVTTVLTARSMKAMGITDLDQALETIPGLHVSRSFQLHNPIYVIRGVYSQLNPQILLLINGIPVTQEFTGNRSPVWGGMPINSIKRIEVIRGPGSAVYGADAFSGVINVITKTRHDIDGTELGTRIGSFDTQEAWLLHGGKWGIFDIALGLEFLTTNGQDEIVDADAQTLLDNIDGTSASLAPGSVNLQRKSIEARLDISYEHWRIRAGFQGRNDMGTGAGVAEALDPEGRLASDRHNIDLTYHNPNVGNAWNIEAQISYYDASQEIAKDLNLFPPGSGLGLGFGSLFPNGVIGNPEIFERHYRFESSAFYLGIEKHAFRIGAGYHLGDMYKTTDKVNFGIDPNTGEPIPSNGPLVDVSDTPFIFLPETDRTDWHIYLQDQWGFAPDWELTAGVRWDNYSDFGETVNPRLALVWAADYNLNIKLLYGEAFRVPSFVELNAESNPIRLGNKSLAPEEIKSLELAFDYEPLLDLQLGLNLFYYQWKNIIEFVEDPEPTTTFTAQNSSKQVGYGLEFEVDWKLSRELRLEGNYAFQQSKNKEADKDSGNAPNHQLYLRADWEFQPAWHLNTQINWVDSQKRIPEDPRSNLDDYILVDLALRKEYLKNHWDIAISVRNLFDEDAREPSPSPAIPNDIPLAGRSFFVELGFHY